MLFKNIKLCSILVSSFLFTGAAAHPAIITTTFFGVMTEQHDLTGGFAPVGTDLTGSTFSLVYTNNDAIETPFYSVYTGNVLEASELYGENSAILTVGPYSFSLISNKIGILALVACGNPPPDPGFSILSESTKTVFGQTYLLSSNIVAKSFYPFMSGAYYTPFSYDTKSNDYATTLFSSVNSAGKSDFSYKFNITRVVQSFDGIPLPVPSPGVPEPSIWVQLIAGFSWVGLILRRRVYSGTISDQGVSDQA